jgi:hypothetical protein
MKGGWVDRMMDEKTILRTRPHNTVRQPPFRQSPDTSYRFDVSRLFAAPRCHARAKRTGKRCRGAAVTGWRVCYHHGAGGGAPLGNENAGRGRHSARFKAMVRANFLADCEDVLKRRGEWVAPSRYELDDPLLYAALKKARRRVAPKFRRKAENAFWWKLNGHNFLHLKRVHEKAMKAKAAVEPSAAVCDAIGDKSSDS